MKTKRLMTLALAGAMCASMAVPAFAAGVNTSTKITSKYAAADIAVTVPKACNAVINPYGLGMTVEKSDQTKVAVTGQIASAPMAITNESALKLEVGASVTGVIKDGSTLKFATESIAGMDTAPTTKSAFVQFQWVTAPTTVAGADADALADPIIEESVKAATWNSAATLVVGTKEVKPAADVTLPKMEAATMDSSGEFSAYPAKSVVLFRLTGDCVESPKEAWATTDGFDVNVAFTFKPTT